MRLLCFFSSLLLCLIFTSGFSQNTEPDAPITYSTLTDGVKYAFVISNPSTDEGEIQVIAALVQHLKDIGFERVEAGHSLGQQITALDTYCDAVFVIPSWSLEKKEFKNFQIELRSCTGKSLLLKSQTTLGNSRADLSRRLPQELKGMLYGRKYDVSKRLELPAEKTEWTEVKLKQHFTDGGFSPTEGIYEMFNGLNKNAKTKIALIQKNDDYQILYLAGATNSLDWNEGEVKATASKMESGTFYNTKWRRDDKQVVTDVKMVFESGYLVFLVGKERVEFIKRFPSFYAVSETASSKAYGSGFALSKEGYIVTNWHVVADRKKITIKGINDDFSRTYNAKVILKDKSNDLAILKIDDASFETLGEVPFVITSAQMEVGTSIFVMGYPLKAAMGEEMKLTNGIISSRSGYEGNITTYQVSAPVQPGNSGGPVFDTNGNLVGIISSKLGGGENVSYAIKTSYLLTLIENLTEPLKLKISNSIGAKPLPEQVKQLRRFTYIVEAAD